MQKVKRLILLSFLTLQGPFPFHPPIGVTITGSSAQQSLAKPNLVIDVAVAIPKACFYEKDHLDCKYHGKRTLWLTIVAAQLKKHAVFKQQEWVLLNNDARYAACCLQFCLFGHDRPIVQVVTRWLPASPAEAKALPGQGGIGSCELLSAMLSCIAKETKA